jgi:hypothetical protein
VNEFVAAASVQHRSNHFTLLGGRPQTRHEPMAAVQSEGIVMRQRKVEVLDTAGEHVGLT